jgi:hypothetical protein
MKRRSELTAAHEKWLVRAISGRRTGNRTSTGRTSRLRLVRWCLPASVRVPPRRPASDRPAGLSHLIECTRFEWLTLEKFYACFTICDSLLLSSILIGHSCLFIVVLDSAPCPFWVFYGPRDLTQDRRASTLSQPDSRRTAVFITLGLNNDYLLQGCTSIFLKRQSGDWYSHLLSTNHEQTNAPRALHALLDMPLTIADLIRNARPESSRFPMTTDAPRFNPASLARGHSSRNEMA